MPPLEPGAGEHQRQRAGAAAARRRPPVDLIAMSQPITGTLVQTYLRERGITDLRGTGSLRFHPRCYYRPDEHCPDRDLAGDDRRRHRPRRPDHRGASHLARSPTPATRRRSTRRGGRWATFSATRSASAWRRSHGGRRRHRDGAVAPTGACPTCRCWRRSRQPISPPSCSRTHCGGSISLRDNDPAGDGARDSLDRTGQRGRDRGDRDLAPARRLQRGSPHPRHRCASGSQTRMQIGPQDVARFMALAA